jgi:hypothetical protein
MSLCYNVLILVMRHICITCCCSNRWIEAMSLNCDHGRACCRSPDDHHVAIKELGHLLAHSCPMMMYEIYEYGDMVE